MRVPNARYHVIWAMLVLLSSPCLRAQGLFGPLFVQMKSPDPSVRRLAQERATRVLSQALPHMDREIPALRTGLLDQSPYIRLQASAVLVFLSLNLKADNEVILACLPELVIDTKDSNAQISQNALAAIAYLKQGAPPSATEALLAALQSKDDHAKAIAAVGLLRSQDLTAEVKDAIEFQIQNAPDRNTKEALLESLEIAGPVPNELSDTASQFLYDPDPSVQLMAIGVVPRMYKDKVLARQRLINLQDSANLSSEASARVKDALRKHSNLSR